MSSILLALGRRPRGSSVSRAWTLLKLSHQVAEGILEAQVEIADMRRDRNADRRGRPAVRESDLLRSAIVVAAGGMDASFTVLVETCLPILFERNDAAANRRYEQFIRSQGREALISMTVHTDGPKARFVAETAKGSFLGSGDLKKRVKGVLGLPNVEVSDAAIESLDPFFSARNQIAHEFDQDTSGGPESVARIVRRRDEVTDMLDVAYGVSASIIGVAARRMSSN